MAFIQKSTQSILSYLTSNKVIYLGTRLNFCNESQLEIDEFLADIYDGIKTENMNLLHWCIALKRNDLLKQLLDLYYRPGEIASQRVLV